MKKLAAIVLSLTLVCRAAEPFRTKVVGVHDGDSITVYDGVNPQIKIRLSEIDAPELKQPYGKEAKAVLSGLIFGQAVTLTPHGKDRYSRLLADVHFKDQRVNLQMVALGAAWRYDAYSGFGE